ncbi:hypothetical protein, conserved [Eimeria brunetti]|uniref:Uncharacterized protein n=1 Tax=Eimeria brunetti TaxID=51314 RepID=U6LIJ2_9EIME|nr:hypothetical protein, conserved [Eimeria brunetti]
MLLMGLGAAAAAGAAFVLPLLLYYHFVDRRKSTPIAALSFCFTLTFALLLALLVPIDIMQASTANSSATGKDGASERLQQPPSVAEAAAAAHASNTAAAAFTPAGAAAAAAAAAGWAALKKATLPLTPEVLQQLYLFLGIAVFLCCFILTPAAIFYANENNRKRVQYVITSTMFTVYCCSQVAGATPFRAVIVGLSHCFTPDDSKMRPGMPPPAFFRPESPSGQQQRMQQQEQEKGSPVGKSSVGLMAAAAAAASAAAATASAAAAAAAAAAQRVDSDAVQLYTAQLLGVHKTGVDSLLYLGACFLCGAQVVWIIFGAFGLACLPIAWLQRRPSTQQQQEQLQHAITAIREQQRLLQSKYAGGRQMSPLDAETFQQLRAQQRICSENKYKLQARIFFSFPGISDSENGSGMSVSREDQAPLRILGLGLYRVHGAAGEMLAPQAAPQYASFGNQTFVPQNGSDAITCSLHAAAAGTSCRLTVFAAALSRVAFVGVLLCLVYVAACQRAVPLHSSAWDCQQRTLAEARAGAGDLDDLAAVDESARLIGV